VDNFPVYPIDILYARVDTTDMKNIDILEVQRALDRMVDSIDTTDLGKIMERQMGRTGPFCSCGKGPFKNLRALSAHGRVHR